MPTVAKRALPASWLRLASFALCVLSMGLTLAHGATRRPRERRDRNGEEDSRRVGPGGNLPLRGTCWSEVQGDPQPGTAREEVFEFTRRPALEKVGRDRYRITFACRAACDVTIAIVGPKGRIARHLASGVLGKNAPPPFQKNSLSQEVFWDGKDDLKRYVDPPSGLKVRVSLGLKPVFGRILGWHPKDNTGAIYGIAADPTGVFVVETGCRQHIVKYDHDGNYLKTIFPPRANLPEERLKGFIFVELADGRRVLWGNGRAGYYGSLIPEVRMGGTPKGIAIAQGKIALMSSGYQSYNPLITLRTDGSTLDGVLVGERLSRYPSEFDGSQKIAASPDGKWLYLSAMNSARAVAGDGLRLGKWKGHCIFRTTWNYQEPLDKKPWVGELREPGPEADRLNDPNGIACDAAGNVYVADTGNDRIQVFSPDARLIKSIKAERPLLVAVHQKTGEIYCFSVRKREASWKADTTALTKLGPLNDPAVRATYKGTTKSPGSCVMCVDSWATPTRVWLVEGGGPGIQIGVDNQISVPRDRIVGENGRIRILNDLGDRLELYQDFLEKVNEDGFTPQIFGNGQMCHVYADPVRGQVYYFHRGCFGFEKLVRFDPESGKSEILNVWGDDLAFGPDGLMYLRRVGHIIRLHPETLEPIYFDYGEDVKPTTTWHKKLQKGAIRLKDQKGAKTFQDGIGVGIDQTICVLSNTFSTSEKWGPAYATRPWKYHGLKMKLKAGWEPYQVRRFPGRLTWGNPTLWLFSNKGELLREDHIPGLSIGSCGIRRDVTVQPLWG